MSERNVTRVVSACSSSHVGRAQAEARDDLVRAPGEPLEHLRGLGRVARLADQLAVEEHLGVDAEHRPARRRRPSAPCRRRARAVAVRRLVEVGRDDLERDRELLEDRAALRRRRREDERAVHDALSRGPYLLARPLLRPLGRHVRVVARASPRRRAPGSRSAARSRSRSRAAGRSTRRARVELDAALGPLEAVHAELRMHERAPSRAPRRPSRGSRAASCGGTRAGRPGRSRRAASGSSGTGRPRSRRRTRRRTRSTLASGSPVSPASASTSGNSMPVSRHHPARRRRAARA